MVEEKLCSEPLKASESTTNGRRKTVGRGIKYYKNVLVGRVAVVYLGRLKAPGAMRGT